VLPPPSAPPDVLDCDFSLMRLHSPVTVYGPLRGSGAYIFSRAFRLPTAIAVCREIFKIHGV
jgi:hypothetical protein